MHVVKKRCNFALANRRKAGELKERTLTQCDRTKQQSFTDITSKGTRKFPSKRLESTVNSLSVTKKRRRRGATGFTTQREKKI